MKHASLSSPGQSTGFRPQRLALLTWAVAWPVITLLLEILQPFVGHWPMPLRSLLLSALMVVVLSLVLMPRLTRRLDGWLRGEPISIHPNFTSTTTSQKNITS